jgi:predicted RNase H-like HicB family nuclease
LELPEIVGYGDTREEAEAAALEGFKGIADLAKKRGRALPAPHPHTVEYSGRVTLRMSKGLHARAAMAALAEDISLNQLIVEAIALRLEDRRSSQASSDLASYEPIIRRLLSATPDDNSVSWQSATRAHKHFTRRAVSQANDYFVVVNTLSPPPEFRGWSTESPAIQSQSDIERAKPRQRAGA